MWIPHIVIGMAVDPTTSDGPFDLHCGLCEHVEFLDDWNRTPYCTHHGQETEIRVGDVCSQFEDRSSKRHGSEEDAGRGADRTIVESEQLAGVTGPFYAVYAGDRKQGWYCSNCEAFDVAAGPMGRLKCNGCGNIHQSNEWDSAYI